jgi:hypothetical protein
LEVVKRSFGFVKAIGFALVVWSAVVSNFAQDHGHLNVGAESPTQGAKLIFANGAAFATNVAYVKTLLLATNGVYNGYYQGNITLTALPATLNLGGPDPQAPALGSYIQAQITRVEGPAGGSFAFWDMGATTPTIAVASGGSSTNLYRLSESDGSPGTDPYGHIHGRRFTATLPGIYQVTFLAFDTSTNGVNGGPIHTGSDPVTIYFQAGINLFEAKPADDGVHVRFGAMLGGNYQVESRDSLDPASASTWESVGDVVAGNDLVSEVIDSRPRLGKRFYRLKIQ